MLDRVPHPSPRRTGHAPHLVRQWEAEAAEATRSELGNQLLQARAKTTYRTGDVLLYDGKWLVEVTQVFPVGYVSVPRKFGHSGRMLAPVVCDQELYCFKALTPQGPPSGQTTLGHLRPAPGNAPGRSA